MDSLAAGLQHEKLITQDEVCELFGFTRRGVENLRKSSNLPYYKIGNRVRFKRSEVEEWLRSVRRNKEWNK